METRKPETGSSPKVFAACTWLVEAFANVLPDTSEIGICRG